MGTRPIGSALSLIFDELRSFCAPVLQRSQFCLSVSQCRSDCLRVGACFQRYDAWCPNDEVPQKDDDHPREEHEDRDDWCPHIALLPLLKAAVDSRDGESENDTGCNLCFGAVLRSFVGR
jgi:hypothetical protein